ncbi:hypothetical protein KVR01_006084 [Diaporthe batatas]|uniref:uncharacterized protein n=1 Tax=Diaporthe batatas TaxID=748121 RepID=UPI001D044316|nr:uncharacterized protein KVR01_006084 [Diaporthe batatas]KAG8164166.1 hypothetical protein KVR01_006084 [Diaporthe batatas]
MSSSARELPRPKQGSRPAGKSNAKTKNKLQNAKYIHGHTEIDRSKGGGVPWKMGEMQKVAESLIVGTPKCRACYTLTPPCDCGKPLYETEVNVFWTRASGYLRLALPTVKRCEDILIREAKRLGMKCVVLRSDHHNTATMFDRTGRKTGYMPADWHITVYLGDDINHLLLQGHVYTFVGRNTEFPLSKLHEGNRKILETHELLEGLTLEEAAPEAFWGLRGSCGWVNVEGQPVNADGTPIIKKPEEETPTIEKPEEETPTIEKPEEETPTIEKPEEETSVVKPDEELSVE